MMKTLNIFKKMGGEWDDKKYIPPSGFDRSKYKNTNYLVDLDNLDIISIGNYGMFQNEIDKLDNNQKIKELNNLIEVKTFNSDALLAITDTYLQIKDLKKAAYYSSKLLAYTPKMGFGKNLNSSLIKYLDKQFTFSQNKLSVCIISKNEEHNISRCLSSIVDIVDEIIIVDTGSTDNTLKIARRYTDKIYYYKWSNDFSAAKNKALEHATW